MISPDLLRWREGGQDRENSGEKETTKPIVFDSSQGLFYHSHHRQPGNPALPKLQVN